MQRGLVVIAVSAAIFSCTVKSGLGIPCDLPRRLPDGGSGYLSEGEVQDLTSSTSNSTRDFVAFGAVDCEDLVCVRDANAPKGTDLTARAKGYCSKPCNEGSTCPADDSNDDTKADKKLSCRALLLDAETLNALAQSGYAKDVGNVKEPFFCARGSAPDAGR